MHISKPDESKIYYFGSYSNLSVEPNDLDVLIIYNEESCSIDSAYQVHLKTIQDLKKKYCINIHPILLSKREYNHSTLVELPGLTETPPIPRIQLTTAST